MNPVPVQPENSASPTPAASGVALVRSDVFFVRRFELPAGATNQEVASFVALQWEELSPFPLEQLFYGYAIATDRRAVSVYATYRRRFPAEEIAAWQQAHFVLPEFAPVLRQRFPSDTIVYLRGEDGLTGLLLLADQELPVRVASRPLPASATEEEVVELRQHLRHLLEAPQARELGLRAMAAPQRRAKGIQFAYELEGSGGTREFFIPGADAWGMDVRDPDFVAEQRRRQGVDVVMWRVVTGAAAVMALLLLGEIFLGLCHGYVSWAASRNQARRPEVARVNERETAVNALEDFGQSGVHPFEMINAVAAVLPDSITFTRATAKGAVTLEIEGAARDIASINAYEAALSTVPNVQSVSVSQASTNPGGSTFRISVTFQSSQFGGALAQGQP